MQTFGFWEKVCKHINDHFISPQTLFQVYKWKGSKLKTCASCEVGFAFRLQASSVICMKLDKTIFEDIFQVDKQYNNK